MDFRFDAGTDKLRDSLLAFMDEKIYPAEPVFAEQMASLSNPLSRYGWICAALQYANTRTRRADASSGRMGCRWCRQRRHGQ